MSASHRFENRLQLFVSKTMEILTYLLFISARHFSRMIVFYAIFQRNDSEKFVHVHVNGNLISNPTIGSDGM